MDNYKQETMLNTMRTAILTAYPKIFTNIENAQEIFAASVKSAVDYGFVFQPSLFVADMAVELEARHKSLSRKLQSELVDKTLIIEMGAGLSTRRLEFKHNDYFELDLPLIIELKKAVYKETGLCESLDGLKQIDLTKTHEIEAILKSINFCKYEKIIIISEGLFWYLKLNDIDNMLTCFTEAFDGKNWMWLTADCPVEEQNTAKYRGVISDSSNRSPRPFDDYRDLYGYFTKKGFSVSRYRMEDIVAPKEIYSSLLFAISAEETAMRMESYTDIVLFKQKTSSNNYRITL